MSKKDKIILFTSLGVFTSVLIFVIAFLTIKEEILNRKAPASILGDGYEIRDDICYIDKNDKFYYKGIEYKINNEKTNNSNVVAISLLYASDNCVIYKRTVKTSENIWHVYEYVSKYVIKDIKHDDYELNISQSIDMSYAMYFDDCFIFQDTITNKCYMYDLTFDYPEEISKDYFISIYNRDYGIKEMKDDKIVIHNYLEDKDLYIAYNEILNTDLIKNKLNDYKKEIKGAYILNNLLIINIELSTQHNILLKYDFENEKFDYFDWIYNFNVDSKNNANIIGLYIVKTQSDDSVFESFIKSYYY